MDSIFGIGLPELFFIAIIALVVLGPERLPGTIREVAKFLKQVRALGNELTSQFSEELSFLDEMNPRRIIEEATRPEPPKKAAPKPKSTPPKTSVSKTAVSKPATKTTSSTTSKAVAAKKADATPTGSKVDKDAVDPTAHDQPSTQKRAAESVAEAGPESENEPITENRIAPPEMMQNKDAVQIDPPATSAATLGAASDTEDANHAHDENKLPRDEGASLNGSTPHTKPKSTSSKTAKADSSNADSSKADSSKADSSKADSSDVESVTVESLSVAKNKKSAVEAGAESMVKNESTSNGSIDAEAALDDAAHEVVNSDVNAAENQA